MQNNELSKISETTVIQNQYYDDSIHFNKLAKKKEEKKLELAKKKEEKKLELDKIKDEKKLELTKKKLELAKIKEENKLELAKKKQDINKRYMGKLIDSKLLPRTEDGLPCCRWCQKGVKPPRRTLCSKECEHELNLRTSGRYLRDCVYKRDNGICSICNIDTKKTAKNALFLIGSMREEFLKQYKISLKRKIWTRRHGGGLWDADHIIPVKDGGGCSSLENMRTLCISCHKIITFKK